MMYSHKVITNYIMMVIMISGGRRGMCVGWTFISLDFPFIIGWSTIAPNPKTYQEGAG